MIVTPEQSIPGDDFVGDDFVTVGTASRLTGLSIRAWRSRAVNEVGQAKRDGARPMARKSANPSGIGRSTWWVHRSLHLKLTPFPDRDRRLERTRDPLAIQHPQHVVDKAMRRNHWLKRWRDLCKSNRDPNTTERDLADRIVEEARRVETGFKISLRSLDRWWKEYRRLGDDGQVCGVSGLVDRYGREREVTRAPAAVEWLYDLYRTENKLSVRTCHEVTLRESKRQGWAWPASYTATVAWLKRTDDLSLTFLHRRGKEAWAHRYLPWIHQDLSKLEPGEMFNADHHQMDYFCTYKNRQIRPWLTAVQDMRSRMIVGWHLGPTPHSDAIIASLRNAFRDYAVPRVLKIDNGKDYCARNVVGVSKSERHRLRRALGPDWMATLRRGEQVVDCVDTRYLGLTGELGIEITWALPYSPQSKMIERFFGRLTEQHAKTHAAYCGNSTLLKPECLDEIRRGYTDAQKRGLRRMHGKDWKRRAILKFVDQANVPTLEQCRERQRELLKTGTDDRPVTVNVLPVRTGFEGGSRPVRTDVATTAIRAVADDMDELFDGEEAPQDETASEQSMDVLFDADEPSGSEDGSESEGMDDLFGDESDADDGHGLDAIL